MARQVIHARVKLICPGCYKKYVFENLEAPYEDLRHFVMVTECPNWQHTHLPNIGDEGFLEYDEVIAGDHYYNRETNDQSTYNYTACYFISFIKDKPINTDKVVF